MITVVKNQRGQALSELVMILPIMILMLGWMINAYKGLRAASVGQRAAFHNLISRLDNRPEPNIDGIGLNESLPIDTEVPEINRYFKAVQNLPNPNQEAQANAYLFRLDPESGPIATYGGTGGSYITRVGICFYLTQRCQ